MPKTRTRKRRAAVDRDAFKLVTPPFRGSFVALNKPRSFGEQEPKYGLNIVLPKDDEFWDELDEKIDAAAEAKWGKVPDDLITGIKDGDDSKYEEWEGCYSVSATSQDRPGVVDVDMEDIVDRKELYSGAWYRASIRVYAWHYQPANRRGCSLQLDNVKKVRDDEPFSGRSSAMDDFADYVDVDSSGKSRRRRGRRGKGDEEEEERPRRRRGGRRASALD